MSFVTTEQNSELNKAECMRTYSNLGRQNAFITR